MRIEEGKIPFRGFHTWYRTVGERKPGKKPLVFLHGGPGSTHNYFEVFDRLAEEDDRFLVMYDQIGCGNSFVEGHPELFRAEVWIEELMQLREHLDLDEIHLMGQSWGGMMAIWYAIEYKPQGLRSLILSSTLSSAKLWEEEQYRRISYMDPKHQAAIKQAVESGNYEEPLYLEALAIFMDRHCNPTITEDSPECLRRKKVSGVESYQVGWGPNEFTPTGTLSGYDFTDRLHEIEIPTLITNGQADLSSPYISKIMADRIPKSRWELFQYSRHVPYIDEHERYVEVLKAWLNEHDRK